MEQTPDLPIPVSMVGGRYFLFSIDAVTYLRREHHICGVLIGSIPHVPQQNVFLGLPMELMPEETRLLLEKGLAYIVDDAINHQHGLLKASKQDRRRYLEKLQTKGQEVAEVQAGVKDQLRSKALDKHQQNAGRKQLAVAKSKKGERAATTAENLSEDSLFAPSSVPESVTTASLRKSAFGVTPATSASLLPPPASPHPFESVLPAVPDSYPLFKHLHSRDYFTSPGMRFGCQYMVYPGDPLRFHSHFLASHVGWDEDLNLMDLVGGGRLGTGVKKGYLIGGLEKGKKKLEDRGEAADIVRTFTIEWAAM